MLNGLIKIHMVHALVLALMHTVYGNTVSCDINSVACALLVLRALKVITDSMVQNKFKTI